MNNVELTWPNKPQKEIDYSKINKNPISFTKKDNNKLFHGDNLEIMNLQFWLWKQKIKLIYIDPPFLTQKVFRDKKKQFIYNDKYELNDYLSMIYERLKIMKELLTDDGGIYVHCDWRVNGYMRLILDEIFGKENFRNEIIWFYKDASGTNKMTFKKKHDSIFWYVKNKENYIFNVDKVRIPYSESTMKKALKGGTDFSGNKLKLNTKGKLREDVWTMSIINPQAKERLGYPTQKPESLIDVIIKASSNKGDLVADFFCGSGTTLAVAEKLERKWIGVDTSKTAIELVKKRLFNIKNKNVV